jgi:uncharacterized protein DUF3768
MPLTDNQFRERIRELNDAFRKTLNPALGRAMLTAGVNALSDGTRAAVIQKVREFAEFTPDNDPHGEHDFGSFEVDGNRLFWKIDYYAPDMEGGSENAADPTVTTRVLTIMFAEEY